MHRHKKEVVASVYYRPLASFFYKYESGEWRGPGGPYTPDSAFGKQLEELLQQKNK